MLAGEVWSLEHLASPVKLAGDSLASSPLKIPSVGNVVCYRLEPSGRENAEQVRCRRCNDDAFTVARACGAYDGALRVSILALKREPHLCRRLVNLVASTQQQNPLNQATRIVPVPLHPERQRTRGFNQAAVIAAALSRATSIVLDPVSLVRTSHTERHRAGMDSQDRRKTVESAFKVLYPALIQGELVLLVDDVFTTGATVSSCAQALREAGAAEVFVLTIARPVSY